MAVKIGAGGAICMATQVDYATANTTWTNWLNPIKCGLQSKETLVNRAHLGVGAGIGLKQSFVGRVEMGGEIVVEATYEGIGLLLKHALGTSSTTGTIAPYTHLYDPDSAGALPYLTCRVLRGRSTEETFQGLCVDTWRLSGAAGAQLQLALSFVGEKSGETRAAYGTTTPTITTNDLILTDLAGTVSFGGNTFTPIDFELSGDNKLAKRNRFGSQYFAQPIISAPTEFRMKMTLEVEDDNIFDDYVANTTTDAVWTFTGPSSQAMTITLESCQVESYTDPVDTNGILKQNVVLLAHATAADYGCRISINNADASATSN